MNVTFKGLPPRGMMLPILNPQSCNRMPSGRARSSKGRLYRGGYRSATGRGHSISRTRSALRFVHTACKQCGWFRAWQTWLQCRAGPRGVEYHRGNRNSAASYEPRVMSQQPTANCQSKFGQISPVLATRGSRLEARGCVTLNSSRFPTVRRCQTEVDLVRRCC